MKKKKLKLTWNIVDSKEANPPEKLYRGFLGMIVKGRFPFLVNEVKTVDPAGNTVQIRDKELSVPDHQGLSFETAGVLYDEPPMVLEQRSDGCLELLSGFGRLHYFKKHGVTEYFADVVTFTHPVYKEAAKIKLNLTKSHQSYGIPNTDNTYSRGLDDFKRKSDDWKDKKKLRNHLEYITSNTDGEPSKTTKQLDSLIKRWYKRNSPFDNIRSLTGPLANKQSNLMGLPYGGLCNNSKDRKKPYYGKSGYNICRSTDIQYKITEIVNNFKDDPKNRKKTYLTAFIISANPNTLNDERKKYYHDVVLPVFEWMKKHVKLPVGFKVSDVIEFVGFHAQLMTPNLADGSRPTERGIVDMNGKIIIDYDETPDKVL